MSDTKHVVVTREGLQRMKEELEYKETTEKMKVAEQLKVAISYGDLSENAEYDAAKNDQAVLEQRIAELKAMIENAVVVDESKISNVHYGAEGQTFSYKTWENVAISLAGSYQIKNAALALEGVEALRKLGYALSDQQVREGLLHTAWRGRFTTLRRDPTVIIDGAHNPAAALELKESLERYFPGKTLYFVMGMFKDKDYAQVIDLTAPLARHIITVETPGNPRAMPARELAEAVGKVNPSVEWADSVAHGVEKALAMAGKEDAVIVFGSLSFLGEAADAVNEK